MLSLMYRGLFLASFLVALADWDRANGGQMANGTIFFSAVFDPGQESDVYSIRPDGTTLQNLTSDFNQPAQDPVVSPDGKLVAFGSPHNGNQIWVMNLDGSNKRAIPLASEPYGPSLGGWLNNSTLLYYSGPGPGMGLLRRIDLDGSNPSTLVRGPLSGDFDLGMEASFSSSAGWIAFDGQAGSWSPSYDIWIAQADGSQARLFYADPDDDTIDRNPVWSRDGKTLYWNRGVTTGYQHPLGLIVQKSLGSTSGTASFDAVVRHSDGLSAYVTACSPDDTTLLFIRDGKALVKYVLATKQEIVISQASAIGSADWAAADTEIDEQSSVPIINALWATQEVFVGGQATFRVFADGMPAPTFRWRFNGQELSDSDRIQGAATSVMILSNAQLSDVGSYTVVVSNSKDSITSAATELVVSEMIAPQITQQPASKAVPAGTTAQFEVLVTGSEPLSYQWFQNGLLLEGATARVLAIPAVQASNVGTYSVQVRNARGSATSQGAELSLVDPGFAPEDLEGAKAQIVESPNERQTWDFTATTRTQIGGDHAGQDVPYTYVKTGPDTAQMELRYDYNGDQEIDDLEIVDFHFVSKSSGTWTYKIVNPFNPLMVFHAGSGTFVFVALPGVILAEAPTITLQPQSQNVKAGAAVTFTVKATGAEPIQYQWFFNGQPLANQTGATLKLSKVTLAQAGSYGVEVQNQAAKTTSEAALLAIISKPSITGQPQNQTVVAGGEAVFEVQGAGAPAPTYQWKRNGKALSGTDRVLGVNSPQLKILNVQTADAGSYTVTLVNSAGQVTSKTAKLTIGVPPAIKTQPVNAAVISGKTASFKVSASGTAPLTYQWQFNGVNLVNSKTITGATAATLTMKGATASAEGAYTVIVSNPLGSIVSTPAFLDMVVPPAITSQPPNQTLIAGDTARFEVTATGDPAPGYQWLKNGKPLVVDNRMAGATSPTLTIAGVQAADEGTYSVEIRNTGGVIKSKTAQLKVAAPPAVAQQPVDQNIAAGKKVTFSVKATGTSPLAFQWFFNGESLVNSKTLTGATSAQLTITSAKSDHEGTYYVVVKNAVGEIQSQDSHLQVSSPPAILSPPQNQTSEPGSSIYLEVEAEGTEPLEYQWKKDGKIIEGATDSFLWLDDVSVIDNGKYSVTIRNPVGSATSAPATVTVRAQEWAPDTLVGQQWSFINDRDGWETMMLFATESTAVDSDIEETQVVTYSYRKKGPNSATATITTPSNRVNVTLTFTSPDEGQISGTETAGGGRAISGSFEIRERNAQFAPISLAGASLVFIENEDGWVTHLEFEAGNNLYAWDQEESFTATYTYQKTGDNSGKVIATIPGQGRANVDLFFCCEESGAYKGTDPKGRRISGRFEYQP